MQPVEDRPSRQVPGALLRTTTAYSWRLLVVGVTAYLVVQVLSDLDKVVIPILVALMVTALLHPTLAFLRRRGVPRGLATLCTFLIAVVVLGGILTLVVVRAAEQAPQLGDQINRLLPHLQHWLVHGPLRLNPKSVDNLSKTISHAISKNSSAVASTALSTTKTLLDLLTGLLLSIFITIFLLYDGPRVWGYLLKGVPAAGRPRVDAAARAAWATLGHYVRGTLIVAAFHGIVLVIALTLLGVPLAFPLAVLVGLGALIPIVGAVVTGILAVAVAGISQGLLAAVVVTVVLIVNNQIEAHALQPFVVGRYVRIHPLAVVLALAAGALLFGIFGAIIAVPVAACANSAGRALAQQAGEAARPEGGDEVPSPGG